jgi:xanthine dehydrogenase YagR molybdenum-binding subunit
MKDDQKTPGRPMSRRDFVKGTGAVVSAISLAPSLAHATGTPPVEGEDKYRSPVSALVQFEPGGRVTVASSRQDLSRDVYTTMAKTAATTLKLRMELIDAKLSDSILPRGPVSRGWRNAAGIRAAVRAAAKRAQRKLLAAAVGDKGSPLCGDQLEELDFRNGRIIRKEEPESGESFTAFLARNGNVPVGAIASAEPNQDGKLYSSYS